MGGGGSTSKSETQIQAPWGPAQPYIKEALNEGQDMFHSYRPTTYQNGVAEFNPFQELSLYGTAQRAMQGNPLEGQAQNVAWSQMQNSASPAMGLLGNIASGGSVNPALVGGWGESIGRAMEDNPAFNYMDNTAQGNYLENNPYLDGMFDAQSDAITRAYREGTAPSTEADFAAAGRLRGGDAAGGGYNAATARNERELMEGLSRASDNVYGKNYQFERQLQEQAAANYGSQWNDWIANQRQGFGQMADYMLGADQNRISAANSMGNQHFSALDRQMNAAREGMSFAQQDWENLNHLYRVGDAFQGQRQSQLDDARRVHDFYQTGAGSPIAALARYWNPAQQAGEAYKSSKTEGETQTDPGFLGYAGAGINALKNIGGMAGLFSDRRFKDKVKKTKTTVLGLPFYSWVWKNEENVPEHLRGNAGLGWMAQDVQEKYPRAVEERNGMLMILPEKLLAEI